MSEQQSVPSPLNTDGPHAAEPAAVEPRPHAFLIYNLLRIGLFAAAAGVFYLLGLRNYLLVLCAVVFSGLVSVVVLSRWRDRAVIGLGSVYARINDRIDARTRAEDE